MPVSRRFFRHAAVFLAALAGAPQVTAADLSPARWPAAIRADVERRESLSYPPFARTVAGDHGLVTGTLSPIAMHAGSVALQQGGSAADAAATAALTEISTSAGGPVTYAGVLQLLYFDASSKKVYALDAQWGRYAEETDPATIPDAARLPGSPPPEIAGDQMGRETLTPGFMAGIAAMHSRFGRLPFSALFAPAIWYAEHGIAVSASLAGEFQSEQSVLWRTPQGRRFASMPDGRLPAEGDLFLQPDTAKTLRAVADHGAGYMYTGDWARDYVATVRGAGGKVTLDDLARYRPLWREPHSVPFEGATVFGIGENTAGTCPTLEALNLLSASGVDTLGPYWRDPRAFVAYARAIRFAFFSHYVPATSASSSGGPATPTCEATLTPQYAQSTLPSLGAPAAGPDPAASPGHHSDAIVAVDRWGDVAVLVHSSNTVAWGVTGLVVGGVPIPDAAGRNKAWLARSNSGDRVPSGMAPVIVLRDGKPVAAVAATGFALVPETVRIIGGLLTRRGDLQTLMSAPPLLLTLDPVRSFWNWPEPVPAGAYDPQLLKAVADEGLPIKEVSPPDDGRGLAAVAVFDQAGGEAQAIESANLRLFAEADPSNLPALPLMAQPQVLDAYVGDYKLSRPAMIDGKTIEVVQIRRSGEYLTFQFAGTQVLFGLSATADQAFDAGTLDSSVTFKPPVNGLSSGMTIHRFGHDVTAARIAEPGPARPEGGEGVSR